MRERPSCPHSEVLHMAQTQSGNDGTPKEQRYNKTLNILAYIEDEYHSLRHWAKNCGESDVDFWAQETNEWENWKLVGPDGEKISGRKRKLKDLKGQDFGDLELVIEKESSTEYVNRVTGEFDELLKEIVEHLAHQLDWSYRHYGPSAIKIDESGDTQAKVEVRVYTREIPMLKKPTEISEEEMESGDIYEDEDKELDAFLFKVKYEDVTDEEVEHIDEAFLKNLVVRIQDRDGIKCIRSNDCEVEQKTTGLCFNL